MTRPYRLAHLSDPHLPLPHPPGPLDLLGKRSLAFLSWRRKKGFTMRPERLAALVADVAAARPDHVAVTGDLVNLALPAEFAAAARWLAALGAPDAVTAVPGNHEALARNAPGDWPRSALEERPRNAAGDRARNAAAGDRARAAPGDEGAPGHGSSGTAGHGASRDWPRGAGSPGTAMGPLRPWMRGDDGADGFPFVRHRGPLALLGLCSAVPTPPLVSGGRLGAAQVRAVAGALRDAGRAGLFRAVLIHHPPAEEGARRVALWDAAALRAAIAREGAELVLHGHLHRARLTSLPGPAGPVPVSGVPGAAQTRPDRPSRWHLHEVAPAPGGGWYLDTRARAWDDAAGAFVEAGRWRLRLPAAPAR